MIGDTLSVRQQPHSRATETIVRNRIFGGIGSITSALQLKRDPLDRRIPSVYCSHMKVTVRRAEAEDAAAIAVCLAALGYGTSTTLVAEKLSALMGSSSDTVLVAEDPTTG